MNPLMRLRDAGQSVWLDFLRRSFIAGGGMERLVREDGIGGVTSNPSIFGKAIGGSTDYDEAIRGIAEKGERAPIEVFYDLALADIQMAADVLRPVYEETGGADGFVSFELEPRLARDTAGSIRAAHELFERIGKPNVMIKVPGTLETIPVVEELTALGVNVNITLLFSIEMYERVALAYIAGLERRLDAGDPIDHVASVASFFVSRVDSAVEALLAEDSPLRGNVAVANAKVAYSRFRHLFSGERWERLARAGARLQRPLWASTGTKNPAYSDVLYVEELVGPDTVNTMPEATLNAFRNHGVVRPLAVSEGVEEAETVLSRLPEHGVDLAHVTDKLVQDGLAAFQADLDKLLHVIGTKIGEVRAGIPRRSANLGALGSPSERRLQQIEKEDVVNRVWRKDHTVWKPEPAEIANRLGWLGVAEQMRERVPELEDFAKGVASEGFTRAVLLGMGGSSLAPQVLRGTFGVKRGSLDLVVLDSTHPSSVAGVERSVDLDRTLFIVASKSGGTVETLSHFSYFFERTGRRGERFIAITDPGTPLEALARDKGFRRVFLNPPDIGGRYSALSLFGLVPGALIGADLGALLDAAEEMACACQACVPCDENPGAWLGAVIGEATRAGLDKLTLVLPEAIAGLGGWVEQLVAESTGKEGTGIIPVVGEPLGLPEVYGTDRLFVTLGEHAGLEALEAAGHPVVRLATDRAPSLGAESFRWEFATAIAGHVLGINAFDQPNVEEAKRATKSILDEAPAAEEESDDLETLLGGLKAGDYVGIQAYLDPTTQTQASLQRARLKIRDRYRVATTLGFGPRFLHSTGQLHKGGPETGVFIQVVDATREVDLEIPGASYTFGALIDAQALGDLRALRARGRRVARVTLEQFEEVTR